MKSKKTLKLVLAGLMAALVCVATSVIVIQLPTGGYANLGDCFVVLSGYILGPVYGSLASGIGAGMSDLFLGYGIYAPFTFIIKACMSVAVYFITKNIKERTIPVQISLILVATLFAELIMVGGYFAVECFIYGVQGALANVLGNVVQGVFACVSATVVYTIMSKAKLFNFTDKILSVKK